MIEASEQSYAEMEEQKARKGQNMRNSCREDFGCLDDGDSTMQDTEALYIAELEAR